MDSTTLEQLHADGVISGVSYAKIKLAREKGLISVYWEVKTLLYLGVLLLSAGLGILVYKNINSIGHQVILLFIALVCVGCFFYCTKNKLPFSTGKVISPNSFFDYVLLLACCTFITFIAYLQYQYNPFGNRYGIAIFFPMVVLFFSAYYFDHTGILNMAIANFAAWLGITVTPLRILASNDFSSATIIFTGLALGLFLLLIAWLTGKRSIKKHFEFTYANFGTHIFLICCLSAILYFSGLYLVWFLFLMGMIYLFYRKALLGKSFYFILIITLYAYIGLSYVVLNLLAHISSDGLGAIFLGFLYFIVSAIGLVLFLIRTNKKISAV